MAITNTNIITYISTNRLTTEDMEYLLEGSTTKGPDAVSSALYWMYARYKKAGYEAVFAAWKIALFSFSSSSLASMADMEAAFYGNDSDLFLEYSMMFEALILLTIHKLYSRPEQESTSMDKKQEAQEIIEGLLGSSAYPDGGGSESNRTAIVAVIESSTDTEKEEECFGMRAGYVRVSDDS
jgi:hypothetical protein